MNKKAYLIDLSNRINEFRDYFSKLDSFDKTPIIELNDFELSDIIKKIKKEPIHLTGDLKIFQNENFFKVTGQYYFSSEYSYVKSRDGYVNLGEQPYALWSAYNVMVELGLVNSAKAVETNVIQRNILPDTIYKFDSICKYGEIIEFSSMVENRVFVKGIGILNNSL